MSMKILVHIFPFIVTDKEMAADIHEDIVETCFGAFLTETLGEDLGVAGERGDEDSRPPLSLLRRQ